VAKLMSGTQTDIALQREDKITISSIFDLRDEYAVTVQGEVRAPATVAYAEKMALADVIQMAGGFREGATPNRIEISRRIKKGAENGTSNKTAEVFVVNLDQDLKLVGEAFALQPFDIVTVRNAENYTAQKQISVQGEIKYPGAYTITNKQERISDLIERAGGLTNDAYLAGASLIRRSEPVGIALDKILQNPQSKYDVFLEEGDVIQVPKQLQTVKVTGEILNSNLILYQSGNGFRSYVNGAGGFTDKARRSGAFVRYANGSIKTAKKVLFFNSYPSIKPGSEIFIPRKPEREKMTAQTWIGIGTTVASMGAIIVSLLRQ